MRVSMATSPASAGQPNEDFVGAVPHAVVLLDGAGQAGTASTCKHGVAWYTRRLGVTLLDRLSTDDGAGLRDVLADAITAVAATHAGTCDLADPSSPSATVGLFRLAERQADYLVLADSVLAFQRRRGAPVIVCDGRLETVGARYRAAVDAAANGTVEHDEARRAYITALRAHRNKPDGFWVAADNPDAAAEAIVGSQPMDDLAAIALLSDGASRLTDTFRLADWTELLALLENQGPAELIGRVREVERSDLLGTRWPRTKTFDDATVAYCTDLTAHPLSN